MPHPALSAAALQANCHLSVSSRSVSWSSSQSVVTRWAEMSCMSSTVICFLSEHGVIKHMEGSLALPCFS